MSLVKITGVNNVNSVFTGSYNSQIIVPENAKVGLVSVSFGLHRGIYIIDATNNTFTYSRYNTGAAQGEAIAVTLASGQYTIQELAIEISTKINAAATFLVVGGDDTGSQFRTNLNSDKFVFGFGMSDKLIMTQTMALYTNMLVGGNSDWQGQGAPGADYTFSSYATGKKPVSAGSGSITFYKGGGDSIFGMNRRSPSATFGVDSVDYGIGTHKLLSYYYVINGVKTDIPTVVYDANYSFSVIISSNITFRIYDSTSLATIWTSSTALPSPDANEGNITYYPLIGLNGLTGVNPGTTLSYTANPFLSTVQGSEGDMIIKHPMLDTGVISLGAMHPTNLNINITTTLLSMLGFVQPPYGFGTIITIEGPFPPNNNSNVQGIQFEISNLGNLSGFDSVSNTREAILGMVQVGMLETINDVFSWTAPYYMGVNLNNLREFNASTITIIARDTITRELVVFDGNVVITLLIT